MPVYNAPLLAIDAKETRRYAGLMKAIGFDESKIEAACQDARLLAAPKGKDVDMGATFDHSGIESHPDWCGNSETGKYTGKYKGSKKPKDGKINEVQFKNRMILREAMLRHGFKALDTEWWHFTLKNEPYPNTYFTFPIQKNM